MTWHSGTRQPGIQEPTPDAGFTLVEVLLASIFLALIAGVVSGAIIVAMNVTTEIAVQNQQAANRTLTAQHYVPDVQAIARPVDESAPLIDTVDPSPACPAPGGPTAQVFSLQRSVLDLSVGSVPVSYELRRVSDEDCTLVRVDTAPDGTSTAATVAHDIDRDSPAPVTLTSLEVDGDSAWKLNVALRFTDGSEASYAVMAKRRAQT